MCRCDVHIEVCVSQGPACEVRCVGSQLELQMMVNYLGAGD